MICISTRGKAPAVSLKEAVLAGIAPDGGLYVPKTIPRMPESWWSALRGKSFHDISIAVALRIRRRRVRSRHADESRSRRAQLPGPHRRARERARRPRAVSRADVRVQGLWRAHAGAPACPERAELLKRLRRVEGLAGSLTVLVATSGDTGSAVAHAFFGVAGTRVVVLYPEGKVSDVQEAQFTTLGGNVTAVAVAGTFDDCQRLAKEAFADPSLQSRVRLTSANSISLGRLLPQMFYYAYAALQSSADKPLTISVPSGQLRQPRRRRDGVEDGRADSMLQRADDDQRHGAAILRIRPGRAAAVGADARQCDGCRRTRATSSGCSGCSTGIWRRCER